MQVPIDNQDFFQAVLFHGVHRADGNIIKNTEAFGISGARVMAGRAHKRKSVVRLSGHDGVDGVEHAACGQFGDFITFRPGNGIGIEKNAVLPGGAGNLPNVRQRMDIRDFFVSGLAGFNAFIFPGHVRVVQHLINSRQPLGAFRVIHAGCMLQVSAILNNSSSPGHGHLPS